MMFPVMAQEEGMLTKSFCHLIQRPWLALPVALREYVSTIRRAGDMLQVDVPAFHILLEEVVGGLDVPKLIRDPLLFRILDGIETVAPNLQWA